MGRVLGSSMVGNGDLLEEGLCHMLCDPGLLQPEPLSPGQATADPCFCRRKSNTQMQGPQSLMGSLDPGAHKVLFEPSERLQ